jgi:DNA-directed RNA polymerase subunit H
VVKQIDILSHGMVPKHELMSKKEKEVLLKKLGVSERELPRILSDDPAIRNLDAKPGDVIRITRASPTAGQTFYYRVVV